MSNNPTNPKCHCCYCQDKRQAAKQLIKLYSEVSRQVEQREQQTEELEKKSVCDESLH